jgi:hypothetical protein
MENKYRFLVVENVETLYPAISLEVKGIERW